jgi:hypothetical protein
LFNDLQYLNSPLGSNVLIARYLVRRCKKRFRVGEIPLMPFLGDTVGE